MSVFLFGSVYMSFLSFIGVGVPGFYLTRSLSFVSFSLGFIYCQALCIKQISEFEHSSHVFYHALAPYKDLPLCMSLVVTSYRLPGCTYVILASEQKLI
jgi:hypothetical protein